MFFWLVIIFILGSAVGSFLNVVIDRTTRGESIAGRSYCDHCRATLSTLDLIPIISFVSLGAKCRYCKRPLSWQYPAVEAVTAILFTLAFFNLSSSGNLSLITVLYFFILASVAVVVAVVDLKFYLIPTTFVYGASLLALAYNFFNLDSQVFIEHVMAAFGISLAFLLIVLVTRGKGMGQGDIVLAFLIGMVLGFEGTFAAIFLAFLTGAIVSIILVALRRKKFGQTVPFAPFLIGGFLVSLFWSTQIINWYFSMLY
ncbi:hypothetical protein A3G14_01370 [Candidatus Curtissbacteria bacterium RIFCSPLOWO2_12_FULL_38_9]|uniref:Prepilin peptidase n=1 Tax=Candidatus Curtissbacteria bacterium RIFCSPLOWO2_12_FULL_38_9 TaxID=1797735 RepID=A0A1F5I732_9BACT|nr:MAG: hypothetical protein A3G14_01370 [Candidatus Curtissbacteria bacterium RIFCSPLOWO2_12_FULL_38_9]